MADLKLIPGSTEPRQPIALGVPRGAKVGLDPEHRTVVVPARNDVLLDTYLIAIPWPVLKEIAAYVMLQECQQEAAPLQGPKPS